MTNRKSEFLAPSSSAWFRKSKCWRGYGVSGLATHHFVQHFLEWIYASLTVAVAIDSTYLNHKKDLNYLQKKNKIINQTHLEFGTRYPDDIVFKVQCAICFKTTIRFTLFASRISHNRKGKSVQGPVPQRLIMYTSFKQVQWPP